MGGNNKKNKNRNKKKNRQNAKFKDNTDYQEIAEQQTDIDNEENEIGPHDEDGLNLSNYNRKKRQHDGSDNESDNEEEKPKRKKKKKQPIVSDTADKKGKKSIRQMKREKFLQRQAEAQAVAKDQLKSQCINYLSEWKHNKQNWKFMKAKQVWLYKNKFSTSLLPDSSWPLLLEYFESAQGNIRKMLLDDASKIIKQMDEWTESQNGQAAAADNDDDDGDDDDDGEEIKKDDNTKSKKPDENVYKRARDLIQCLEE